jgi:hypothetical protein
MNDDDTADSNPAELVPADDITADQRDTRRDDDDEQPANDDDPPDDEPYLNRIRRQAASARARARDAETRADTLARELWTARVAALGLLADPTDLPYDPELLADADAIADAVAELLAAKPHLRRRQIPAGLAQASPADTPTLSLGEILRANA